MPILTHNSTENPKPPRASLTRRAFLARSAAASLLAVRSIVPASVLGRDGTPAPSDRIGVALIGVGCMGNGHLHHLAGGKDTQLLAVCDPDRTRREQGAATTDAICAGQRGKGEFRGCAAVNDYREVLGRADVEGVVIATPDHWHALASIHAAQAGKHVYCEKPVSLTIQEGREIVQNVRRYTRVFQTGTQYRSIPVIRRICDFVRTGGLGQLKGIYTIWMKTGIPTLGESYIPLDPTLPAEAIPAGLDWDLWVGPAPWHPYNSAYHRNPIPGVVPWTFCDAFGAAAITNYHSHAADVIQYAIGMETSGPVEIIHPSSGLFPTLTCRYANGVLLHHVDHWGQVKKLYKVVPADARLEGLFGGLFVGERGWITSMSAAGPIEASSDEILREAGVKTREVNIGSNRHHANWYECIRAGGKPSAHEEIGHRSASLGHLVATSFLLKRSLRWDPAKEEYIGDDEANRLRSRARREPWQA
jgi:hypothetical protein